VSFPRYSVRRVLALTISLGFIISCFTPFLPSVSSQVKTPREERKGTPRRGKPEGTIKSLDEIRNEQNVRREQTEPVPSTIRSSKMPLNPWDGRRVGGPAREQVTPGKEGGEVEPSAKNAGTSREKERLTRRAHASRTATSPYVLLDDALIDNFYTVVMTASYTPLSGEKPYWRDQLRVGYAKNQTALNLAAIELGKTLLESSWYLSRSRTNSEYVSDLYWAYLMRAPDTSGWSFWTNEVSLKGRETVRRAFEESGEFLTLMTTIVPNGSASSTPSSLISAQTDPRNQPGGGLLTRDGTWSLPLISLPGRSGLDLGLALSYSSQVWTKSGPYIYFDEDNGMPSPGFRLGFPTIQRPVFNSQTNTLSYLVITSSGRRVELRQVGTSNVYEAADSSYLQLTDNGSTLLLRSTDGTQLTYQQANHVYHCIQVKDRNGNYLSVSIGTLGQITTITDTLGRVLTFNYDSNVNLLSITQTWGGSTTHTWASFSWTTKTMQSSFSNVVVIGPKNGTSLPVLNKVTANDGENFEFDYNNSLQVIGIRKYHEAGSPTLVRATNTFTYETPASDVPRLTDSRISALNWTGINGVPSEVVTQYSVSGSTYVMTAPDGTIYKEIYGTGYKRGLVLTSEVWSGGVKQKWITSEWTQDNTGLTYELNPRVIETNIYDAGGNRRRKSIEYKAQFGLPHAITEYAADGSSGLRFTIFDYKNDSAYLNRRIIGLRDWVHVYDGSWNLMSKTQYNYDWDSSGDMFQDTPAAATQHDRTNYGPSFIFGRGNLSQMARWDVTDPTNATKAVERKWRVNSTGSVLLERDHLWHQKQFAYGDDFSDSVNRNTFAYPTVLTDEDGNQSLVKYNFDFGATTRTQSPTPAGQSQGAIQTMLYNDDGLLERVTTSNNSAYRRFWYGPDYVASNSSLNTVADETYSIQYVDGVGRPTLNGSLNPWSTGGYKAKQTIYDQMGRAVKVSNPTEINGFWTPAGDDAAGWLYTQQTYDWQGKPLITTNPDSTTKQVSYSGCGCAGGEVVTLTDEGTVDGGVTKRRQQKIYSDAMGRTVKTEILNWQGGSVYSATVNTYNARDQITKVRQYAGPEGSGTYQDTDMTYDGHGRLKTKHVPDQGANKVTTWTYNNDDSVQSVTDGRGAATNFTYNNRRLTTGISWSAPSPIPTPASVTFAYDAAGNKTSMTDGFGSVSYEYDQLSRLTAETRTLTGVTNPNSGDGKFKLSYSYGLAGQLKKFTDATNMSINYAHDDAGRVTTVTGSDTLYANVSTYASSVKYRAWGGLKSMTDGKSNIRSLTYNSKLQPSQFQVSGNIVNETYDYYNDGGLSFLHNQLDNKFDRSYRYDHVARLTELKTGGTARNDAVDTPLYESFGYNAFNNLTARQTNTWNDQTMASDSASFSGNRRVASGWTYDDDGRSLTIGTRTNKYDASGRQTQLNATRVVLGHTINTTRNYGYDGMGARIAEGPSTPPATYYLRSSVMGGAVVMEIDSAGQKTAGYVYSPISGLLATQTVVSSTNVVTWLHVTPSGSGEYSVNSSNSSVGRVEFDPLNAAISTTAPPTPPALGGQGEVGPNHFGNVSARFGDLFNTAGGCYVDGIESTCDMAMSLLNRGAGDRVMKAMVYNKGTKSIDWYGDVHAESVAGFAFIQAMDGKTISGESGRVGSDGSAPDRYGEVLGDIYSSSVTIKAGANLASTSSGFEANYLQPQAIDKFVALDTAKNMLILELRGAFGDVSEKCKKNVLDKLASIGFNVESFTSYLERGNDFQEGTTSNMSLSTALAPGQIKGTNLPKTVSELFAAVPGINALTSGSLSPTKLTVFFKGSSIDGHADSHYNRSLMFHEGLHGYGSFLTGGKITDGSVFGAYSDQGLLKLFGLNTGGASSQITQHIRDNCY
jgi:YD repeat-containing protein